MDIQVEPRLTRAVWIKIKKYVYAALIILLYLCVLKFT